MAFPPGLSGSAEVPAHRRMTDFNRIEWTDFSLLESGVAREPRSEDEMSRLWAAFPTAEAILVFGPMMVIRFSILPPKPWPLAVAGLPVLLTTDQDTLGLPIGRCGTFRLCALEEHDARTSVSEALFDLVIRHLESDCHTRILSVVCLYSFWLITVADEADKTYLPARLAKLPCFYHFATEVKEPPEAAIRNTRPTGVVWDPHTVLRPGVMLSSGRDDTLGELLTTSGVEVVDKDGARFVTVASQGFPLAQEDVFHPDASGHHVGHVEFRLVNSDIALMRLLPGQRFENSTFSAIASDGSEIPGGPITAIRDPGTLRLGDWVRINNPFCGLRDAVHMGVERRRLPSDEPVEKVLWVRQNWHWMGADQEVPSAGSCGSALVDDEGRLVSFFRFLREDFPGIGIGVAGSTLQEFGYELSTPGHRANLDH